MNKKDVVFFICLFLIILVSFLLLTTAGNNVETASVYYDNKKILTMDLSIDKKYEVNGDNGKVIVEVLNKKIRVIEETSNKNLCSKQGFIEKSYEMIICLPNKIYIKFDTKSELDGVVK